VYRYETVLKPKQKEEIWNWTLYGSSGFGK